MVKLNASLRAAPLSSLISAAWLLLSSGTIARERLGPNAMIGARSWLNQTAHSVGSLVSKPAHSTITSPPGIHAAGSIRRIFPALLNAHLLTGASSPWHSR